MQLSEEGLGHLSNGLYAVPTVGVATLWLPAAHTKDHCEVFLDVCLQGATAFFATCLATVASAWLDCMKGCLRLILPPLIDACMKRCTLWAGIGAALCLAIYVGSLATCWLAYRECVSQRGMLTASPFPSSTMPTRLVLRNRLSWQT